MNDMNDFLLRKVEPNQEDFLGYIESLANYIRCNNIKNLILIDGSARILYIGVKTYLHKKFPDVAKSLNIYFVNPDQYYPFSSRYMTEIFIEEMSYGQSLDQIVERFRNAFVALVEGFNRTYPSLVTRKDEPTLLFDICIHSGDSMEGIQKILRTIGFNDLRLGVLDNFENQSRLLMNLVISRVHIWCKPFGKEGLVKRNGGILSERNTDPCGINSGTALRRFWRGFVLESLSDQTSLI